MYIITNLSLILLFLLTKIFKTVGMSSACCNSKYFFSFVVAASMRYFFSQSTGKFCNESKDQCAQGYSGYKGETDQTKKNAGPIPVGTYTIDNTCRGINTRCNLTPDPSNNMFGRSSFQIHGDNTARDNSASQGCIILDRKDRSDLKKGDTIHVTQ
jgi:hypothetical protein